MGFKEWLAAQESILGTVPKVKNIIRTSMAGMTGPARPAKPIGPKKLFSPAGTFTTPRQPSGVAFGR